MRVMATYKMKNGNTIQLGQQDFLHGVIEVQDGKKNFKAFIRQDQNSDLYFEYLNETIYFRYVDMK